MIFEIFLMFRITDVSFEHEFGGVCNSDHECAKACVVAHIESSAVACYWEPVKFVKVKAGS